MTERIKIIFQEKQRLSDWDRKSQRERVGKDQPRKTGDELRNRKGSERNRVA